MSVFNASNPSSVCEHRRRIPSSNPMRSTNRAEIKPTQTTEKILECFLKHLTVLDFSFHYFTSIPQEISQLSHLKHLNVAHNYLSSLPEEITRLNNLEVLDLTSNSFQAFPVQMYQLTSLRHLNFSFNRLSASVNEETKFLSGIFGLPTLRILKLSGNLLTELPEQISQLVNLEELCVDSNKIRFLPPGISKLTKLNRLNLSVNYLSEFPLTICELTHMQHLDYSMNNLTTLPAQICQLTSLECLEIRFNRLRELPQEIGHLTKLKTLDLHSNQIMEILPEIVHLTQLTLLSLPSNQISSLPNEILSFTFSTTIRLEENPLSPHVIHNLQQAMNTAVFSGPRISFSMPSAFINNYPFDDLLNELFEAAAQPSFDFPNLRAKEEELKNWLSRLAAIGDYKTKRKELAYLIYQALVKAEQQADFREFFWRCIKDAHMTCGDRMALSVIYLDLRYKIETAGTDLARLAYLIGHGIWALSELEKIAANKARTLKFVDEIEVYLAFPIQLKDKLHLPILLDTMLYFGCSSLTESDLQNAAEIIKRGLSNKKSYCDFLATDPNWQKALERERPKEYAQICSRKELATEKAETNKDYECILNMFHQELSDLSNEVLDQVGLPPFLTKTGVSIDLF